jgi:deazaflavin-dependent oxidoreductase (nitroreductase family)
MWFNPIIKWLLRSPLHGLVSKNMMLITYTGRKSGQAYTIPVNYLREGDLFTTTSFRQRTWWRNLRGSVPVTLRVQGQELKATAKVIEDEEGVTVGLMAYLQTAPHLAKYFQVALDPDGQPNPEDVARSARDKVVVRTELA